MRADNKAFAKVSADNFFILQMATKHLSLNKHFGRQLFQNAQVVAANRYRKPYWLPCNFKLTAFKQTFQDDFLTEFDTLFTDKPLLRIFIFCPRSKKLKFLLPPANGTFAFAPTHKLTLRKSKRAVLSNAPVTTIKLNSYICTAK